MKNHKHISIANTNITREAEKEAPVLRPLTEGDLSQVSGGDGNRVADGGGTTEHGEGGGNAASD